MSEEIAHGKENRVESFINACRLPKDRKPLILNADYLDDEALPDDERSKVLTEIFSRDVRECELKALSEHLSPCLNNRTPSHLLTIGVTGSGKTVSITTLLETIKFIADRESIPLDYYYVDLSQSTTAFAGLNRIAISIGQGRSYFKGIPIELMQSRIRDYLNERQGTLILFLDEIDSISVDRDVFMTFIVKSLPRQVRVRLIYIFSTNRLNWENSLDARTKSCLKKNDIIFNPYHALEIRQILELRIAKALDQSRVDEAAIARIAAVSSKDSGDARKAIELLMKSSYLAERAGGNLTVSEVEEAEKALEYEKAMSLAESLPLQQKISLAACYSLLLKNNNRVHTGEVFEQYQRLANTIKIRPISQRRFSDIISSFDLYSLINTRVVSHGRYGKSREIYNSNDQDLTERILDRLKRLIGLS